MENFWPDHEIHQSWWSHRRLIAFQTTWTDITGSVVLLGCLEREELMRASVFCGRRSKVLGKTGSGSFMQYNSSGMTLLWCCCFSCDRPKSTDRTTKLLHKSRHEWVHVLLTKEICFRNGIATFAEPCVQSDTFEV